MKLSKQFQISALVSATIIIVAILIVQDFFSVSPVEIYSITNDITVVAETYIPPEERININYATAEELMELKGIGEKISEKIIIYRDENGEFSDIYELLEVDGISNSLFLEIKPYIIT